MSGIMEGVTSLGSEATLYGEGKWTSCQNGAETSNFDLPAVLYLYKITAVYESLVLRTPCYVLLRLVMAMHLASRIGNLSVYSFLLCGGAVWSPP
jgi:hypothetical protein